MNILITDDEPLARQRLLRIVESLGTHTLLEAENGVEAVQKCNQQSVDLVLLDIRMPEMDGLEAAWHIAQMDNPPAVIFVTAYDDYALKAFSVNAVDYLLKPVNKEKIAQAIDRARSLNRLQLSKVIQDSPDTPQRQHISARLRGEIHLVPIKDILFFQADQKYVSVRHLKGEVLIEDPLKQLEVELGDHFVRIHRNALVNKRFIAGLTKDSAGHLKMSVNHCDDLLEVSRRHASDIRKLIKSL